MLFKAAVSTLLAGIAAAAYPANKLFDGNAITAPLNEVVPACKPFTIKWSPSPAGGTVSLILLKGPSTNVVPYKTIVDITANSGSFSWTPDADIPATGGSPTGYGIQIINQDGDFQYSTQFGISSDSCAGVSSSSSAYPSSSSSSSAAPSSSSVVPSNTSSTDCSTTTTYIPPTSTDYPYTTGGAVNSTIVLPTKSMTVPSSLLTTATGAPTTSKPAQATGAASGLQAGAGLAGAVAALFMLL